MLRPDSPSPFDLVGYPGMPFQIPRIGVGNRFAEGEIAGDDPRLRAPAQSGPSLPFPRGVRLLHGGEPAAAAAAGSGKDPGPDPGLGEQAAGLSSGRSPITSMRFRCAPGR